MSWLVPILIVEFFISSLPSIKKNKSSLAGCQQHLNAKTGHMFKNWTGGLSTSLRLESDTHSDRYCIYTQPLTFMPRQTDHH